MSQLNVTSSPINSHSTLAVTYRSITDLSPYAGNARTHSKAQIRKIADSIRTFGFTNPVLIDAHDMIVAGHGRVEAAKVLDMAEVPTIRLESLTPAQVRAYIIADNRLAEDAGWNEELLRIELEKIILDGEVEIASTGFEVAELDLMLGAADQADPEDSVEDLAGPSVTQPGDLWHLGDHRVLCGDVRDESALRALMGDRQAQLVFTDPPYNVVIEGNVSGKGVVKHADFSMGVGEMCKDEFTKFLTECLSGLARFSSNGAVHFVCMDWRHMSELLAAGDAVYDTLLNVCAWVKNNGGQGSFYRSRHELVFVFRNGKGKYRNNIQLGKFGRYRTNVWEYPAVRALEHQQGEEGNLLALHPTVKPVALVADAILDCSARGELVLDGFLGSGSTLIAAERVGRACCGMEIDPGYVDVAIRRWQRYSGGDALHAATGETFAEREVARG